MDFNTADQWNYPWEVDYSDTDEDVYSAADNKGAHTSSSSQ